MGRERGAREGNRERQCISCSLSSMKSRFNSLLKHLYIVCLPIIYLSLDMKADRRQFGKNQRAMLEVKEDGNIGGKCEKDIMMHIY